MLGKKNYIFLLLFVLFAGACAGSSDQSSTSDPTDPSDPTNPTNPADPTNPTDPGTGTANPRYYVQGDKIYFNDAEIHLFGLNWSGAQDGNLIVDGLWERGYDDIIADVKALGFNAVRLPFCPDTLGAGGIGYIDASENPALVGLNSSEALDVIVNALNDAQMFILLDHHNIECGTISELWYTADYSEDDWINDLVSVATRYSSLEYFIGLDLKNEPHGAAQWGNGIAATDWKLAAEAAATAVLAANDQILVFVEGVRENFACSSTTYGHWDGGNLQPQSCYPLDIDSTKLVLSPHVYGPDVYVKDEFNDPTFPANMPAVWDEHFGFLVNDGSLVVPGEFGGKYGEGDARDDDWQNSFVDYLISKNMCSFFYWAINPNSTDTGGIFLDDWVTIKTGKVENLQRLMEACP